MLGSQDPSQLERSVPSKTDLEDQDDRVRATSKQRRDIAVCRPQLEAILTLEAVSLYYVLRAVASRPRMHTAGCARRTDNMPSSPSGVRVTAAMRSAQSHRLENHLPDLRSREGGAWDTIRDLAGMWPCVKSDLASEETQSALASPGIPENKEDNGGLAKFIGAWALIEAGDRRI